MDTNANPKESYVAEYVVGAGYLLFFCLAVVLCSAAYYFTYLYVQPRPVPVNTFATGLPPTTPTPHILPLDQQIATPFFKDDFSDDSHGWIFTDETSTEQVTLGKLLFESKHEGYYVFETCASCPYLSKPFYLQADFSTGRATDQGYGIYFNSDDDNDSSFLFEINTEARTYYFFHDTEDGWSLRTSGESDLIQSFPAVNTLGIYARQDSVELYVNGKILDSYKQSGYSFDKGDFGFFVDGVDFTLIIDNLSITGLGK